MKAKNNKAQSANAKLGKAKKSKHHYCTTLTAQRERILKYLQDGQSLTTLEARTNLDIMHPDGRIMELRCQGWNIKMHWETVATKKGKHRVGKYYLSSCKEVVNG